MWPIYNDDYGIYSMSDIRDITRYAGFSSRGLRLYIFHIKLSNYVIFVIFFLDYVIRG